MNKDRSQASARSTMARLSSAVVWVMLMAVLSHPVHARTRSAHNYHGAPHTNTGHSHRDRGAPHYRVRF